MAILKAMFISAFFLTSGHQNVLATAKRLIFQSISIKIRFDKKPSKINIKI